jgi:hypothetical protein
VRSWSHGLSAAGDEALPHSIWFDGVLIRVQMVCVRSSRDCVGD